MVVIDLPPIERGPNYLNVQANKRIGYISSLRASGSLESEAIDLRSVRTLTITCKGTYGAGPPLALRAHLLYSPDGNNWDTVDYASFDLNVTASTAAQESVNVDTPEHGFMRVQLENLDTSTAATNVEVWRTIVRWAPEVTVFG